MMLSPLRTAYHSSAHTVSSLSSAYSQESDHQQSSAPTTPLFKLRHCDLEDAYVYGNSDGSWLSSAISDSVSRTSLDLPLEESEGEEAKDNGASTDSICTYASTAPSVIRDRDQMEEYASISLVSRSRTSPNVPTAPRPVPLASSPSDFASYFPSTRRFHISHPNDYSDGNMNISVQTEGWATCSTPSNRDNSSTLVPMTLFHLRMHNLKNREFSLRRYSRDSGREVCHTTCKYNRPATAREVRPSLQRRISNVLAGLKMAPQTGGRTNFASTSFNLERTDSGYGSMSSPRSGTSPKGGVLLGEPEGLSFEQSPSTSPISQLSDDTRQLGHSVIPKATDVPLPTNTTKLEFSNYMHLDLRRKGGRFRGIKRYDFEHWGLHYSWHRRITHRNGARLSEDMTSKNVEFHLHVAQTHGTATKSVEVAHIVPEPLSKQERLAELRAGGWVPKCSLWISDASIIKAGNGAEIADVIVATGLLALVDDAIKRRWDRRDHVLSGT